MSPEKTDEFIDMNVKKVDQMKPYKTNSPIKESEHRITSKERRYLTSNSGPLNGNGIHHP